MELLEFTGNVGLALVLGVLIGLERQLTQHPAGLRTNALVAVGAALFVSLTRLLPDPSSPSRVASYISVGIGFLGGGVIIKEAGNVRGLTTAAGIWCSAAVGTLAGLGFGAHAAIGTGFSLLVLVGFHPLDGWLGVVRERFARRGAAAGACYRVRVTCREDAFESVRTGLLRLLGAIPGAQTTAVRSRRRHRGRVLVTADVTNCPADAAVRDVADRLMTEPGVLGAGWKHLPPTESRG